jgi:hypothetical protein
LDFFEPLVEYVQLRSELVELRPKVLWRATRGDAIFYTRMAGANVRQLGT